LHGLGALYNKALLLFAIFLFLQRFNEFDGGFGQHKHHLKKQVVKYILFSLIAPLTFGCLGVKHLQENEALLYREGIVAPATISTDALADLYAQEPNRKFLDMPVAPLVGIYYFGKRHYDTTKLTTRKGRVAIRLDKKITSTTKVKKKTRLQTRKQNKTARLNDKIENGNTIMQWGEPVSVYDSSKVEETKARFSEYLFNQGYFTNTVSAKVIALRKFVNVTYRVVPDAPYLLDSIHYKISDSAVHHLLQETKSKSALKPGDRYIDDNFSKERERIDLLLRDNGFYDFSRQYIEFEIDTSYLKNRKVSVVLIIRDPVERDLHKQFMVDSINLSVGAAKTTGQRQHKQYRDVTYSYWQRDYNLKVLSQRVFIRQRSLYNRSNTLLTQRQLANLDAFKFVNINYDTANGRFIANIFTSPLDRYEWSNEVGVNVTQGFPGPFYNLNFKKRNIFKGLENFDLNGRIGFEGVAAATDEQNVYTSTEAGINASLTFPQFIWPLNENARLKSGRYNPKTRVSVGYAYTDRPEYRRTSTNVSTTYTWQNRQSSFFSFSLVNLSIINSKNIIREFQELLDDQDSLGNRSLSNSFRPSFVSSLLFTFTWNPNNYGNAESSSNFLKASLESGGTVFNFINPTFITDQGLSYFKYLRASVDLRRLTIVNKALTVAARINAGVAYSYNPDKSLPYEKFFFAGGSNSVRAWRPRRLGPGSLQPALATNPKNDGYFSYQIEQPAEALLEGSLEMRMKLFGFVSAATFIDAGNVWTRQERRALEDEELAKGSSKFDVTTFYKQIGVGTGFGLRFDFSFLILRLDAGIKVYDPARIKSDRFVLDNLKFFAPFGKDREPVIYNIGIGYPF
jgi:outer membrane protein insertion porin family